MKKQIWNRGWLFWEEQSSFALQWAVPETARPVTLPHDAMLAHAADPASPNGGSTGYRDGGNGVYAKKWLVPVEARGGRFILHFEGVYANASVYINGQRAAYHPYGYTGFFADISGFLCYGEENEIRVSFKNTARSSRWYSGAGIYRDIWLLTAESEAYFAPESLRFSTKKLTADGGAVLLAQAEVRNDGDTPIAAQVRFCAEGCTAEAGAAIAPGERETVSALLNVPNARLWSDETPVLCRGTAALFSEGRALDEAETEFGIRLLLLDTRHGLRVNGRSVKLRGACVHHDSGVLGAATFADAEYRRVRILKEAGFNAIRTAHNPSAPALLRACDEVGMYVMEEAFDAWTRSKADYDYAVSFDDWWQRDIEAMVSNAFNHPSVVLYSVGNEIPEGGLDAGAALCTVSANTVKALDPTRFVTACINGVFTVGDAVKEIAQEVMAGLGERAPEIKGNVNEFMVLMDTHLDELTQHEEISRRLDKACAALDVAGYNYMTARYEKDIAERPGRIMVGSETYPPEIARNWGVITKHPQLIGDFTWTGWDYIGEAGVGVPAYAFGEGGFGAAYPCQLAGVGDIDITGFRRPVSYFREIVFGLRREPYIAVQNPYRYGQTLLRTPWLLSDTVSSWTYPDCVGKPVCIEVYACGDEVELLLNGVSLGRRPAGEAVGYITRFETAYAPGVLEAVNYEQGRAIGRVTLCSAEGEARLCAQAEAGQTGELVYISLSACDAQGTVDTHTALTVRAEVTGAAEFRMGSGNPKPDENYTQTQTKLWNGRAQLIVRKKSAADAVRVRIDDGNTSLELTV